MDGRNRRGAVIMTKETTLEPTVMIEELMFYIHQNEMGGDFIDPDNRFFPLYLELQKLLDKVNNERHDLYVSVKNDEVRS
jgi:hypothetical protein